MSVATCCYPNVPEVLCCLNKQQGKQNNASLDWLKISQSLWIVSPFGKSCVTILSRNVRLLVSCGKEDGILGGPLWTINSFSTENNCFQVAGLLAQNRAKVTSAASPSKPSSVLQLMAVSTVFWLATNIIYWCLIICSYLYFIT